MPSQATDNAVHEPQQSAASQEGVAASRAPGVAGGAASIAQRALEDRINDSPRLAVQRQRVDQLQEATVQRRIGFEFESTGDTKWRFHGRDRDDEDWAPIRHTKAMLIPTGSGLGGLSADNGNVEMRTEPLSTWAEVDSTIDELAGMVTTYRDATTVLAGATNTGAKAGTGKDQNRVVGRATFPAKPQASLGVSMMNIPNLFEALTKLATTAKSGSLGEAVANPTTLYQTAASVEQGQNVLIIALEMYRANVDPHFNIEGVAELEGFMAIVFKTLWDAYSNSGNALTDPKYAFPIMARTDFTSMVRSMPAEARASMMKLMEPGYIEAAFERLGFALDVPVFPGGYTTEDAKRSKGPTKRAWLRSIFYGDDPKDLLSPAPGYPRHGAHPEGMGAMREDNVDPSLAIFELRNLTNGAVILPDQWKPLARIVATLAADTQDDEGLRPT